MIWAVAAAVWITLASGVYLCLSRDVFRVALGLAVVGAGVNLALLASGRLGAGLPAVVPKGEQLLVGASNPLPQALVLTAIVIGFALVCFSLALVLGLIRDAGTDDALELRAAEPVPGDEVKPPQTDPAHAPDWPPEGRP
ncbi:MAG: NADH-quinone oxidoreductase subunit K [Gammaproteobacteria bacterium]|nr:NADH-quinone oxidoreductase subunit K [Gammaproteobacteria bacterium]TVQ46557.1 MAG: cation:proton antiporter [Gammaproteobacteria bacterium]